MKIGVTGGCGYLGTLLSSRLSDGDRHVDILDVRTPAVDTAARLPSSRFSFRRADLSDPTCAQALLGRYDVIVHLAALTSVSGCEAEPKKAEKANVLTTENVLRFRKDGARLLFLSTMAVYGNQAADRSLDETCDVLPESVYAKTKSAAEFLVRGQKDSVILRVAENFGFSPAMRHDLTVHRLLKEATSGHVCQISPDDRSRPLIHSRDTVETLLYFLSHWGRVQGELYNVGNPSIHLDEKEIEILVSGKGRPMPNTTQSKRFDYQKLRSKGVHPHFTLADAVTELLPYYTKGAAAARLP